MTVKTVMEVVARERETEEKVRSMDAHEIVEWIHDLEDMIEEYEELYGILEEEPDYG